MQPMPFPKTSGAWIIVRNLRLVEVGGKRAYTLTKAAYDYWKHSGGWSRGGASSMKFDDRDSAAKYIKDHRAELASMN